MQIEHTLLNQSVLYNFALFGIFNELLLIQNCLISTAYRKIQTRSEMNPPSVLHIVRVQPLLRVMNN